MYNILVFNSEISVSCTFHICFSAKTKSRKAVMRWYIYIGKFLSFNFSYIYGVKKVVSI